MDGFRLMLTSLWNGKRQAKQTDYAWVVDNQGRRHLRNITALGDKDPFQYFMRLD